jgi:hypothetical protein
MRKMALGDPGTKHMTCNTFQQGLEGYSLLILAFILRNQEGPYTFLVENAGLLC